MKEVNIYVKTSVRGPGKRKGKGIYLLETTTSNKLVATLDGRVEVEASEVGAELETLLKALSRLNQDCIVNIHTDVPQIETGVMKWIRDWIQNGWKNAKGKDIANKEQWQQLYEYTKRHAIRVFTRNQHEYRNWLNSEVAK